MNPANPDIFVILLKLVLQANCTAATIPNLQSQTWYS